jgi:two-component system response regulator CssR
MTFGDWVVDTERHSVTCASRPIQLTTKEYDLLAYLLENQREVLSRDKIMRDAWGADDADSPRSVDNFVKRLRVKLPFLHIETIYGVGYRCVQ